MCIILYEHYKRDSTLDRNNKGCKDFIIGWNSSLFSWLTEMTEFKNGLILWVLCRRGVEQNLLYYTKYNPICYSIVKSLLTLSKTDFELLSQHEELDYLLVQV